MVRFFLRLEIQYRNANHHLANSGGIFVVKKKESSFSLSVSLNRNPGILDSHLEAIDLNA